MMSASAVAFALPPVTEEIRYCGPPNRDANGVIIRRTDVIRAFRKAHPCPVTGQTTGACSGWFMDHVVPLACGGCDAVWNLQWMPRMLKSAKQVEPPGPKDRWELEVYEATYPIEDTGNCKFQMQEQ